MPETGIELFNIANRNCFYCNKKNLSSYLCLFCGNKICIDCFAYDETKYRKEYSFIYHSKKCIGGNGLFLNIKTGEIEYVIKRSVIRSEIFIYMNDFGEEMKENSLSNEYKLNTYELKKAVQIFIDVAYR